MRCNGEQDLPLVQGQKYLTQYYAAKIVNPIRDLHRTIFMELLITIHRSIIHFCASFLFFFSPFIFTIRQKMWRERERETTCVQ